MTYPSDEVVMRAIQHGELDLLGVLFDRYSQKALAKCRRFTREAIAAEDLVQEAFLRVLRFRKSFRHDAAFSSWLYRIVHNVCLDYVKANQREHSAMERLATEAANADDIVPWDDERVVIVEEALRSLAPDKRDLIVMCKSHGFKYAEVAEMCGSTEGAVRVKVHRALQSLRDSVRALQENQR